jgi:hypothetical protein
MPDWLKPIVAVGIILGCLALMIIWHGYVG